MNKQSDKRQQNRKIWSLKTEQNVNLRLARIINFNNQTENKFLLESLILAQDERWRHA